LPGVGAFDAAMQVLKKSGMAKSLIQANLNKIPIFGICLGMQLLFEESEEGSEKGLGLIEGSVKKIIKIDDIKIPHMGWNETHYQNKSNIFNNIKNESFFYYVHSYECVPLNKDLITSYTNYGNKICSSIENKNIIATQFHPEKSGVNGIKIYKNFVEGLLK
jgi:glutamine amidotransferase